MTSDTVVLDWGGQSGEGSQESKVAKGRDMRV